MKTKRITAIVLCLFLCVIMGGENLLSALFIPTSAANEVGSFDNTAIEDDLKNVDLKNYPQNSLGEVDIISLMEYGYSEQSYIDKYFGIYVYVYNPTGKPIALSGNNYVNFGFYDNGEKKYDSVNLQYLDRTSDNLIYKFKLDQSARILASARSYAAVNEGKRCYEIAKIDFTANRLHADISKKYVWSGYAAYCGPDSSPDSTLTCLDYGLKSIHLNLMHTNYRFGDKDDGYRTENSEICDEINSVFFTLSEEYFQDFGNLNKISAQWYEYKTNLMYVTSNAAAYSSLFNMRNVEIDMWGRMLGGTQPLSNYRVSFDALLHRNLYASDYEFQSAFNPYCNQDPGYLDNGKPDLTTENIFYGLVETNPDIQTRLDWLFFINSDIAGYDILGEDGFFTKSDYRVSSNEVKEYMKTYTSKYYTQDRILGKYAVNLFADSIDEDRYQFIVANRQQDADGNYIKDSNGNFLLKDSGKLETSGLVQMDFYLKENETDINIGNSFVDSIENQSLWSYIWFGRYYDVDYSPIVTVSEGDLYLSVDEFSKKYYVNVNDVAKFKDEARKAYNSGEVPMLLRFAVTDYYSSSAYFEKAGEIFEYGKFGFNGYVAQETVFLDFDVLSLGFMDEENGYIETLIPVVAEPIDIINGLTPPDSLVEDEEWYQKLVALILLIIVLFVGYVLLDIYVPWLAKIIRWVVGAFWWLFTSLVKLITWPFRALLSNVTYKVKRKIEVKASRRRSKRKRGRPSKKSKKKPRSKKETRNQRFMKETFSNARAKASEMAAKAKAKASSVWSDIKTKIRGK